MSDKAADISFSDFRFSSKHPDASNCGSLAMIGRSEYIIG